MKIQLALTDDGPPFLFLGDPKNLTLSLTYNDSGPKEIDFSCLSIPDQKKVLNFVQTGAVESDVSHSDLLTEYKQVFSQNAPSEPEAKQSAQEPAKKPVGADTATKISDDFLQKEEKFQAKCKVLVKKSPKLIKAELKQAKDTRMLKAIRDLELQKKSPRTSVLNFIELETRKLHKEIVQSIENDAKTVIIKAGSSSKKETFLSDVVESEQEIVQLTPEMLIGK